MRITLKMTTTCFDLITHPISFDGPSNLPDGSKNGTPVSVWSRVKSSLGSFLPSLPRSKFTRSKFSMLDDVNFNKWQQFSCRQIKAVEINFLCVHKKLRAKRMTPVLIKEITRRVNLMGIFQAVYTAGVVIPKPIAICRYYHRSLNPKKLIEVKFSHLSQRMTLSRTQKLYKLPEYQKLPGYRKMDDKDVKEVHQMLNDYLSKFDLCPVYSIEEVEHWFLPRADVVDSFVVEDPTSHEILGFSSFYSLPSTVMHHPTYKSIKAAYSFYNVGSEKVTLKELMQDALVTAKNVSLIHSFDTYSHNLNIVSQAGYDVFNALDLMDNKTFLEDLKFGIGDGNLHYYLFNWKCANLQPQQVCVITNYLLNRDIDSNLTGRVGTSIVLKQFFLPLVRAMI